MTLNVWVKSFAVFKLTSVFWGPGFYPGEPRPWQGRPRPGSTPTGVRVKKQPGSNPGRSKGETFCTAFDPGRGRGHKFFSCGKTTARVRVRVFCPGQTPAGVSANFFCQGQTWTVRGDEILLVSDLDTVFTTDYHANYWGQAQKNQPESNPGRGKDENFLGRVSNFSRGKTTAAIGVRIFLRDETPAAVRGKNISLGQAPAGGREKKIYRG